MSNPLSPKWRVERDMFSDSTEWILGREPWTVRAAPIVGLLLLVIATLVARQVTVPTPYVYQMMVASNSALVSEGTIGVDIPLAAEGIAGEPGDQVILRTQDASGSRVEKIHGTILDITPRTDSGLMQMMIEMDAGSEPPQNRVGAIYVMGEQQSLINVLLDKYLKRRRG